MTPPRLSYSATSTLLEGNSTLPCDTMVLSSGSKMFKIFGVTVVFVIKYKAF